MKKILTLIITFSFTVLFCNALAQLPLDSLYIRYSLDLYSKHNKPFLTLSNLLEYLPGMYQFGVQTPGQSRTLLLNGTRENHSVILIDGLPLPDYLKNSPEVSLIPVENIKKIDLYPGLNPFGINTIGGVINISTKKLTSELPYTEFVYRTGSAFFSDFDVTYGQHIGSKLKILSGVMLKKFGERESTNEVLPYRKYQAQKTRASFLYTLNDFTEFCYSILSNRHDLRIPYNIPFDQDSSFTPSRNLFRIDHTLKSILDLPELKTNLWLNYTSEKTNIKEFRFYPHDTFSYQSTQMKLVQRSKFLVPLQWGAAYSHADFIDTSNTKLTYFQNSFFVQVYVPLSDRVQLLTEFNLCDSKFTEPDLYVSGQVSYNPSPIFHCTVEYNQNSALPTLPGRYGFPVFFNTPLNNNNMYYREYDLPYLTNPNLRSEYGERIQLFCSYGSQKQLYVSSLLYYQSCRDLITISQSSQNENYNLQFKNNYNTTHTGINSTISMKLGKHFLFSSSLNYLYPISQKSLYHIDLPNLQGLTNVSWNHKFFKDDLDVTLLIAVKYWSEFYLFSLTDGHTFHKQLIPSRAVMNAKASLGFMDHTYLTFSADNLLNQKISDTYHVFIPHSFYRIGISWELFD